MNAQNKKREQARLMYLRSSGKKSLPDIAQKLGVPLPTVKSWKKRDRWDQPPEPKAGPVKKMPHAPPGNRFALGNKGPRPLDNTFALNAGRYESIYFSNLTDEERALIHSLPMTPKEMLEREAVICAVRERRILERIRRLQEEQKSKMVVTRVRVTKYVGKNGADASDAQTEDESAASEAVGKGTGTVTTAESENIAIPLSALEKALSEVQAGMRGTMIALQRIRNDAVAQARLADQDMNDVEDLTPLSLLLKGELQENIQKGRPPRAHPADANLLFASDKDASVDAADAKTDGEDDRC